MSDVSWSPAEKKIARRAYEAARMAALDATVAEFKARATSVSMPDEMWAMEDFLRRRRRELDEMLDYRYSMLPYVFAQLIRAGHLELSALDGLAEDKLADLRNLLSDRRR